MIDVCLKLSELLGALLGSRDTQGLLLVVVEVAGVAGALTLGYEGRLNL